MGSTHVLHHSRPAHYNKTTIAVCILYLEKEGKNQLQGKIINLIKLCRKKQKVTKYLGEKNVHKVPN